MTCATVLVILDDIFKKEDRYKDKPLYKELAETYREALETADKYRWHDLRKNPEDLPKCNGRYIVWRPNYYEHLGAATICYFDGSDTWHDSDGVDFTRILNKDDVIAWREIEPFKSGEAE